MHTDLLTPEELAPHVASYERISQDKYKRAAGVGRQKADNHATAAAHWPDLPIVSYTDNDKSAYSGKHRPRYEAMCRAIREGRARAAVAWDQDRLLRLPRELEDFIDLCVKADFKQFRTAQGDIDLTDDGGQFKARIMAAVAKKSSDDTRRRVKRAKAEAKSKGHYPGGPIPYGVERFNGPEIITNPAQVAIIEEVARRVLNGGSLAAAHRWARVADPSSFRNHTGWRNCLLSSRVLPPETLASLRALLTAPERTFGHDGHHREHWLSGLLVCDVCSAAMRVHRRKDRVYWLCPARPHGSADPADVGSHSASSYVPTNSVVKIKLFAAAQLRIQQPPIAPAIPATADPDIENRMAELTADYLAGDLTRAEWVAARDKFNALAPPAPALFVPEPVVVDLESVWGSMSVAEMHRAARSYLREVRVKRSHHRGPTFDRERIDCRWWLPE